MNAALVVIGIALLAAAVAVFVMIPGIDILFIVIGLMLGWLGVASRRRVEYLIATVALAMAVEAPGPLPIIGLHLAEFLANLSAILMAGAVVVVARCLLALARDRD